MNTSSSTSATDISGSFRCLWRPKIDDDNDDLCNRYFIHFLSWPSGTKKTPWVPHAQSYIMRWQDHVSTNSSAATASSVSLGAVCPKEEDEEKTPLDYRGTSPWVDRQKGAREPLKSKALLCSSCSLVKKQKLNSNPSFFILLIPAIVTNDMKV